MKNVEACLSAREDRESSFHHCRGTVRLVEGCLCAGKTWQSRFNLRAGAVEHVEACLSAKDDRESSFHRCGGAVRLEQACLSGGNTSQIRFNLRGCAVMHVEVLEKIEKAVFTTVEVV